MLRITVKDALDARVLLLEGKIAGPWAEELLHTWQALQSSLDFRRLQIDLRAVSFVDLRGRQILKDIFQKTGATFLTASPLTRHFADEAMQKSLNNNHQGD